MNHMKIKFLKTLTLAIILSIGLSAKAYVFESEGIYYDLISEEGTTVEVTHTYGSPYFGDITIPAYVYDAYKKRKFKVVSIGDNAFSLCEVTSIIISEGITSICNSAFKGCESLTSVTIPDDVTSIGLYAFSGCKRLSSIMLPDELMYIGSGAFQYCYQLASVTIPNKVTSIGSAAFEYCNKLTSITIPDGVESISSYTFRGCTGLTSVIMPAGITNIDDYAFQDCSGLTYIKIPEGVISIGSYAFSGCSRLTYIIIPSGLTSISSYAFSDCAGLTSITIPDGVKSIGSFAFTGCTGLESVKILDGVTSIGYCAFTRCPKITSVTIGVNVKKIEYGAFDECTSILEIRIFNPVPPKCNSSLSGVNKSNCILYVPQGTKEAYSKDPVWGEFFNFNIVEFETGGVNDIRSQEVKVTAIDNVIRITGSDDNEIISVYGANCQQIYKGKDKTIEVPTSGLYLVKIAGKVYKMMVNFF